MNFNRSMKSWLQDNKIEIFSTYNEGKSIAAERLIRTLKIKYLSIRVQYQKSFKFAN